MNLDSPFIWIFFAILSVGYVIAKGLGQIHKEVKEINSRLAAKDLEEHIAKRENR